MSPRVTRSAAKLTATANNVTHLPSATHQETSRKKRKVNHHETEAVAGTTTTGIAPTHRKIKRPKLQFGEEGPDTTTATKPKPFTRSTKGSRSSDVMSAENDNGEKVINTTHAKPLEQLDDLDEAADQQTHTAPRRRSGRKKSVPAAPEPSSPTSKKGRKAAARREYEQQFIQNAQAADTPATTNDTPGTGVNNFDKFDVFKQATGRTRDEFIAQVAQARHQTDALTNQLLDHNGPGLSSGLSNTLRALSGMMSGTTSTQYRTILENLRAKNDPSLQMTGLSELSEALLVSDEDSLAGHLSPTQFVKELVPLMQTSDFEEANPDMMLLACRCLANLIEVMPSATASVVYGGAVPVLCQKLVDIQYIDLAEQALITLQKISVDYPSSIVKDGGLTACLTYLDFFPTATQRTAVTTAANCCKHLSAESFDVVCEIMPILLNVLGSNDQRVVEQGSLCVCRIMESFQFQVSSLESLVSHDLLKAVLTLLLPGTTNLIGNEIHTQFIKMLATIARVSPKLSAELLRLNIADALYQILTGVSPPQETEDVSANIDKIVIMQALIRTPRDHVVESLNIICALLPALPTDDDPAAKAQSTQHAELEPGQSQASAKTRRLEELMAKVADSEMRLSLLQTHQAAYMRRSRFSPQVDPATDSKRKEMLYECPSHVRRFVLVLFPTLMHTYTSTVNLQIRQRVVLAQQKMLLHFDVKDIAQALQGVSYASFLAAILSQQDDPSLVTAALQCSGLLLQRLPDIYGTQVYREGIMDEVERLLKTSGPVNVEAHGDKTDDDKASSAGVVVHGDSAKSATTDTDVDHESEDHDDENDHDDQDEDEHSEVSDVHARVKETIKYPTAQSAMALEAQRFMSKYGPQTESIIAKEAKKVAYELTDLATSLRKGFSASALAYADAVDLFRRLASYFGDDALTSVTSHELLTSGIVECLVDIFALPDAGTQAQAAFMQAFGASSSYIIGMPAALAMMINKLQDVLSRTEDFKVLTVYNNSSESTRGNAASMLAKQMQLKLRAVEDSGIPKTFQHIMVSIHAIATVRALGDYLKPRIDAGYAIIGTDGSAPSKNATDEKETSSALSSAAQSAYGASLRARQADHLEAAPEHSTSRATEALQADSNADADVAMHDEVAEPDTPDEGDFDDQPDEEDEEDETDAFEAVMDDLVDEDESETAYDPSPVDLDVANTGKVVARKEDGTPVEGTVGDDALPSMSRISASARTSSHSEISARAALRQIMSNASAVRNESLPWHLEFSVNGQPLSGESTIYQAVQKSQASQSGPETGSMWSAQHTISFKRVEGQARRISSTAAPLEPAAASDLASSCLASHPMTATILKLMSTLHSLVEASQDLNRGENETVQVQASLAGFVNAKLTAKLNRQLEELLIVASNCMPAWSIDLARLCPFLFPFETRHAFLQATSFGAGRYLTRRSNDQPPTSSRRQRDAQVLLGRSARQKVRISRNRVLESALKVMEMYGSSRSILEVEYFEEVGTGLGPTLEFYSTVSREFAKRDLKLWRGNESDGHSEHVFATNGLFPAPMTHTELDTDIGKHRLHLFKMLGKFVARAMYDSRMIDISFNPVFFRLIQCDPSSSKASLSMLSSVDRSLAKSLESLVDLADRRRHISGNDTLTDEQKTAAYSELRIKDARIEDLSLDFTLPGYPAIELVEHGSQTSLTLDNVESYVEAVVQYTLVTGVSQQMDMFRTGFSEVFAFSALRAFTPSELVMIFGHADEDWSLESKS